MTDSTYEKKVYDHRLRNYIRETKNISFALKLDVARSTISNWIHSPTQVVISHEIFDLNDIQIRHRILQLEHRIFRVTTVLILLLMMIRLLTSSKADPKNPSLFGFQINYERLPEGKNKKRLLLGINQARKISQLQTNLRILKLNSSRYHSWARAIEMREPNYREGFARIGKRLPDG